MKPLLDIIIPTYNNPEFFDPCVESIIKSGSLINFARLIIVNNGSQPIEPAKDDPSIIVLNPKENLGWEGGLKLALEHSDAEFVCFQNDDTFIPRANANIYHRLLPMFLDPKVGAIAPTTTVSAGWQSVFRPNEPRTVSEVPYVIFFTVIIRRKALDEVGGIDDTLPGGDDLDVSIRLRKAGYKVLVDPGSFLIHHGFKTGERVRGGPETKGGWNSLEMSDDTNKALIQKHGFKAYFDTVAGQPTEYLPDATEEDIEGKIIRGLIEGEKVVELGVGGQKTIESVIGVDRIPKGEPIPYLEGRKSVADVVADVQEKLPFETNSVDTVIARHIIEHCLDLNRTLTAWTEIIKPGGLLIISTPDQQVTNGIPMNPEHVHAFSQDSLESLLNKFGMVKVESKYTGNSVSFVGCYRKESNG